MLVELRGDGSQTMIPPSMHPNGEQLTWIETNQEQNDISYEDLLKDVSLLAAASELMQHWVEGRRPYFSFRRCCQTNANQSLQRQ